jgi:hypothetical protein
MERLLLTVEVLVVECLQGQQQLLVWLIPEVVVVQAEL